MEIPGLPIYCIRIIFSIQLTVVHLQQRFNMLQQCYSKIYGSVKECRMNFHENDAEMCEIIFLFGAFSSKCALHFFLLLFVESNYFMRLKGESEKECIAIFSIVQFSVALFSVRKIRNFYTRS